MKHCAACGAEVEDDVRFCPHCGEQIGETDDRPLKDYWAERLSQNQEEDWLEEPEEEDLLDLNEDTDWLGPEAENVMPPARKKFSFVLSFCLILAGICIFLGFYWKHDKMIQPIPGCGMYFGCTSSYEDVTVLNQDDWVELLPDGTFQMMLTDSRLEGQWHLQGETFQAFMAHRDIEGKLKDGILSFEYAGMQFIFALPEKKNEVLQQETMSTVTVPTQKNRYERWAGDYYGSIVLSEGTEAWEGNSGESYDVCGRIQVSDDGTGKLSLWNDRNKPGDRFCLADVIFTDGTTDMGKMYAEWGKFYDMELGPGEWVVDPGKSPCSQFANLFYFRGSYMDPANPGDTFVYEIFLRPWGENWEDIIAFYEEPWMVPSGYHDWYLPLVQAGQSMPEHF